MDKRLFLALILTALVVVVTPILFPTQRAPGGTAADSVATRRADTVATTGAAARAAASASPVQGAGAPAPAPARDSAAPAGAAAAETTVVDAGRSTYAISSVGAAPVSVRMNQYQTLLPARKASKAP